MLGWHITVFRQNPPSKEPAGLKSSEGQKVAVWSSGFNAIDWLHTLAKNGEVIDLGGDGYPYKFTAPRKIVARHLD